MLRWILPVTKPERYFYDTPDGTRMIHPDADGLYKLCLAHGLDMPYAEWYPIMIHKVCLALPPGTCHGTLEPGDEYAPQLTWGKLLGFMNAILASARTLLSASPLHVSDHEANRRGFICSSCKHNTPVTCRGCHGIQMLAETFLRGRKLKDRESLGACDLCGCFLEATCFASKALLSRIDKTHEFPPHCWRGIDE